RVVAASGHLRAVQVDAPAGAGALLAADLVRVQAADGRGRGRLPAALGAARAGADHRFTSNVAAAPAALRSWRPISPDSQSPGLHTSALWPAVRSASSHSRCSGRSRPRSVFSSRYSTAPGPTITRSGNPGSLRLES